MADNFVTSDFQDKLQVEGINFKGFGVLPKYVMLDPDLTIEAKTIYAYFCSFAGNGTSSFPSRDRILAELPMSKDAYYKHFKLLTEQGYLTVAQDKSAGIKGKNIYTLVSNPKKFEDNPEDTKHSQAYVRIRFSGLKAAGYGLIPKAVMVDDRIGVKAKGIYAYFCSFTGSGNNAFPKKDKILFHLGISEPTYYKFFTLLVKLNYITTEQRHINGRWSVNDYYLNDTPDITKTATKGDISTKKQYLKKQDTVEQDAVKQDLKKQDTVKQDANITNTNKNNITKNNSEYNQSINQQPAQPEQIDRESENIEDFDIQEQVETAIWQNKGIPHMYREDRALMEQAIQLLAEWGTMYPTGYQDELKQAAYNMCVEALIDMCCSTETMKLRGALITGSKALEYVNKRIEFSEGSRYGNDFASLYGVIETAIDDYIAAVSERKVYNHLQYMKSCIWNVLQIGDVDMHAAIKRDFG